MYLLWEAKEYDPTCGKHSDVITLKRDGGTRRLTMDEVKYWEEHFLHLKQSLKLLPLLSCATAHITDKIYNPRERIQRFLAAFRTLTREQRKNAGKDKRPSFTIREEANCKSTKNCGEIF